LLILPYPTIISRVFCSYLGTYLTIRKELIPVIVKRLTNTILHNTQFSCIKQSNETKKIKIKIYKH
jgi:hypothetical protein